MSEDDFQLHPAARFRIRELHRAALLLHTHHLIDNASYRKVLARLGGAFGLSEEDARAVAEEWRWHALQVLLEANPKLRPPKKRAKGCQVPSAPPPPAKKKKVRGRGQEAGWLDKFIATGMIGDRQVADPSKGYTDDD